MAVYGRQPNAGRSAPAPTGNMPRADIPPIGKACEPPVEPRKQSSPFDFLGGIIGNLHIDPEKALLVFLLIILARDGADITLLLVLAYILMEERK